MKKAKSKKIRKPRDLRVEIVSEGLPKTHLWKLNGDEDYKYLRKLAAWLNKAADYLEQEKK